MSAVENPVRSKAGPPFALVAVPAPMPEPLTYAVPGGLRDRLAVGMRVLVPLGRRRVTGVVVGFERAARVAGVKEIAEALDDEVLLDEGFLELCRWAADYYVASLGEVLAAALPPLLRTESRVAAAFVREPETFHGEVDREVLDALRERGALAPATLSRLFPRRGVRATAASRPCCSTGLPAAARPKCTSRPWRRCAHAGARA